MLDEQGIQTFFQQIHELWIRPELNQRFSETGIPSDFRIREALIKLPSNRPAIVEFNQEIQWELKFKISENVEIEIDRTVHLHEVEDIEQAMPPTVEGERVAFIYLFWGGYSYQVIFDFSPNGSDFNSELSDFHLDKAIANHMRSKMRDMTVSLSKNVAVQLQQIGLWIPTCLISYPLSKIVERIGEGKIDEARQVLISHCNDEFISTKLVNTWQPIRVFSERRHIFDDALFLHTNQRYHGSINTLIGQVEGVIAEWLHEVISPSDVKWKIQSRVEQFHDVLRTISQFEYAFKEALESTIEFLREGEHAPKPFQAFKSWLDRVDPNFPARHAIGHGKYVPDVYTEENSIKMFLLLDTICQFMMFYEVRVLGRDLGQDKE